ncbi:MAG: hypothetical protein FRX49_07512 [Trebouxia sp. A1-2]|nr:MAG: hypothetical protein FRX49_07512 [Trebouxia sp. A1-2]
MTSDTPQLRRRVWRSRLSASKLFQAVRKAAPTYPAPDVEPARSLPEGSVKVRHLSRSDSFLNHATSPALPSAFLVRPDAAVEQELQTQGKVGDTEEHIYSTWSDTSRSKDLAELKSLLEEKSSEYAELLKQHEFSLARVTSELSERSKQLQAAQTDAHQAFQQSKAQHADLLKQLHRAQVATQQAHDAQAEAEQQLQTTQQVSAQKLNQLQAALERQQEDSVRREHQMLQEHMAGLAAKDTMVQQMWSELHESKQGSRRFELEATELAAELRCTESQLGKSERDVKGWVIVYKQLVDDKISLVNERHHLMNRIARLEEGASTYLTGQHHNWQAVPPPRRPSTQSSPAQDVYAEAWPDTPRPSLPDEPPTLSDDNPLAPAQLDHTPPPEPEQAMIASSLAAQHSAHAHTPETAVQEQGYHLHEQHAHQTDGSSGPYLDRAHSNFTIVAADQADREEEVGDVEEEGCGEQDSAHLTITHAPADQAEEAEEDGTAEEEENDQQPEPAQDPASYTADEDESGGSSSEDDCGSSSSEDEEDDQEGKVVGTSSSAGSSGTVAVPISSSTTSSDGPAVPTPAVDTAGAEITGGASAAIRPSPEDADSTDVSSDESPAVPSFEAETVGDAVVSLTAAAGHHEFSITADSSDATIPSSPAQNEKTSTPPAGAAETSVPPVNKDDEEEHDHPVYDSLSEEEEESGEEISSSKEEDAAEEEAAEASEYEEDETEGSAGEEEEDVASDQHGEAVAALHRKIKELEAKDSGWRAGYAKLHKTFTSQAQHLAQLQGDFARVWADLLALQMVASDAVTCSQRPSGAQPRFARSPHTLNSVDMTHIKVIQHRLFNLMDADGDGVLSEEDVTTWVDSHLKAGTIDRDEVMRRKFEGSDQTELETQPDWQLCSWVVEQIWRMLREMFAPQSQDPRWKGVSAIQFLKTQLGHDVGALLCSPLEFSDDFGGSRTSCIGSRFIHWGPLVQDHCSELDFTADVFRCYG